jgi:hypothetical protein
VASAEFHLQPPAPVEGETQTLATPGSAPPSGTEADRLRDRYRDIGEAQGHKFGEGTLGTKAPNFNLKPEDVKAGKVAPPQLAPPPQEEETEGEASGVDVGPPKIPPATAPAKPGATDAAKPKPKPAVPPAAKPAAQP